MFPFGTPPENICIVRLSVLGDVTHVVPVLRAIQKNWPSIRVIWNKYLRTQEINLKQQPAVEYLSAPVRGYDSFPIERYL